jgi:hypothetical protein
MAVAMVNPMGARAGTPRERTAAGTIQLATGEVISIAASGEKGASGVATYQVTSDSPVITIPLSCAVIIWQTPPFDQNNPVPTGNYNSLFGVKAWGRGSDGRIHYLWSGDYVETKASGEVIHSRSGMNSYQPAGPETQCSATLQPYAGTVAAGQVVYAL